MMPESRSCSLIQAARTCDNKKKKKKKKKRKKGSASSIPSGNTQKPQIASLHPETLPVSLLSAQSPSQLPRLKTTSKKDGEGLAGSGRRNKKQPKNSLTPLTVTNNPSCGGAPAQGYMSALSTQARESLRWEGVLEDAQAEEKRLELYRAKRRQRYIEHREALMKETPDALRQTFPKESTETESDQQENAS